MSEKNVVTFLEEWQTGFFLLLGSVCGGILALFTLSSVVSSGSPALGLGGFLSGAVLTFLLLAYLLYGR